jgi:hypothetical protein
MADVVQQGISTGRQFQLLKADPAFLKLWNYADGLIRDEEKKFFDMPTTTAEEEKRVGEQRLRVKHYQEFKGKLDQKITATIATLTNNR